MPSHAYKFVDGRCVGTIVTPDPKLYKFVNGKCVGQGSGFGNTNYYHYNFVNGLCVGVTDSSNVPDNPSGGDINPSDNLTFTLLDEDSYKNGELTITITNNNSNVEASGILRITIMDSTGFGNIEEVNLKLPPLDSQVFVYTYVGTGKPTITYDTTSVYFS